MTPEDIVTALATSDPTWADDYDVYCALCDETVTKAPLALARHEPTCPWRQALEYITKERA